MEKEAGIMPPKSKVTKGDILNAAVELARAGEPLNARALAQRLGCSTQPVFSNYAAMEALRADVIAAAMDRYHQYLSDEMESGRHPPYKASGMGYIRFALEEKELFKLLFMRDRSGEVIGEDLEEIGPIIALIQEKTGMSFERSRLFHLEMWLYVHGIATMLATGYLPWTMEDISAMLTDAFEGLRMRFAALPPEKPSPTACSGGPPPFSKEA